MPPKLSAYQLTDTQVELPRSVASTKSQGSSMLMTGAAAGAAFRGGTLLTLATACNAPMKTFYTNVINQLQVGS